LADLGNDGSESSKNINDSTHEVDGNRMNRRFSTGFSTAVEKFGERPNVLMTRPNKISAADLQEDGD
jgi:hypothetical protein